MPFKFNPDVEFDDKGAAAFRTTEDVVFIDVGDRAIESNVVRDGIKLGIYEIDQGILDEIVVGPAIRQVVISQSIPPGTPVPVGTAVDLGLAPTGRFPGKIIPGLLPEVEELEFAEMYEKLVLGRSEAVQILSRVGPENVLPEREVELMFELFEEAGFAVDESNADAALRTLQAANTFGA